MSQLKILTKEQAEKDPPVQERTPSNPHQTEHLLKEIEKLKSEKSELKKKLDRKWFTSNKLYLPKNQTRLQEFEENTLRLFNSIRDFFDSCCNKKSAPLNQIKKQLDDYLKMIEDQEQSIETETQLTYYERKFLRTLVEFQNQTIAPKLQLFNKLFKSKQLSQYQDIENRRRYFFFPKPQNLSRSIASIPNESSISIPFSEAKKDPFVHLQNNTVQKCFQRNVQKFKIRNNPSHKNAINKYYLSRKKKNLDVYRSPYINKENASGISENGSSAKKLRPKSNKKRLLFNLNNSHKKQGE